MTKESRDYKINITVITSLNGLTGVILRKPGSKKEEHKIDVHRSQINIPNDLVEAMKIKGSKILPKLCEAVKFSSVIENKEYLRLSLGAIYCYLSQKQHWVEELLHSDDMIKDSFIFFELFDAEDNLVYSPLDLLNPITVDYESKQCWFLTRNRFSSDSQHLFLDDKEQTFVIAKRQTDYKDLLSFIATSLDVYKFRVDKKEIMKADYYSLQSVYSKYTENQAVITYETLICSGVRPAFLVLSTINNDLPF